MNKLFSIAAAAVLLAACTPSETKQPAAAAAAASAAANHAAEASAQVPALALPADVKELEALAQKAVAGYEPAAEKQIVYFGTDSQPADKPVAGGFYREVLGKMPDGRLVVQDFYQDNGKPQILPAILKQGADVRNFSAEVNDGLVVWVAEDGSVVSASDMSGGQTRSWTVIYRDGKAVAQARGAEQDEQGGDAVFLYDDGKPMMWGRAAADGKSLLLDTYYPNGVRMSSTIMPSSGGGEPIISAWNREGKPVPLSEIKEDWETMQQAVTRIQSYVQQSESVFSPSQANADASAARQAQ
ncbi:hypothetical protein H9Q10_11605 [Eikenella sp. S3360]|uniref:Lipoprotein n=1 Tax=Eikenella glucosivorans TaxID=2766967 RepID=A0ABS0ND97_9NEIS|nr:hypothetical protein [Eikenella glucosivorans]MBH5330308.1 hypothetical protein [Eikenella glucosivorans]